MRRWPGSCLGHQIGNHSNEETKAIRSVCETLPGGGGGVEPSVDLGPRPDVCRLGAR